MRAGSIDSTEFGRFLRGEFAIDRTELVLKLKHSFELCERNGMSVVKLFTQVTSRR